MAAPDARQHVETIQQPGAANKRLTRSLNGIKCLTVLQFCGMMDVAVPLSVTKLPLLSYSVAVGLKTPWSVEGYEEEANGVRDSNRLRDVRSVGVFVLGARHIRRR
jgi:hypothetical protein